MMLFFEVINDQYQRFEHFRRDNRVACPDQDVVKGLHHVFVGKHVTGKLPTTRNSLVSVFRPTRRFR